jgi:hypothetical protein
VQRLIVAVLAVCCIMLGLAVTPALAAPAHSADATPLSQLTITSALNGFGLDDQNGTLGTGSIIVTNPSPGYAENWHLGVIGTDDDFTIVNSTTGLCIDGGFPDRQQNCDGRSTENWYFQPVNGSASAFLIRQEGAGNCLDVLFGATYSDAWTGSYGCNGNTNQRWTLPSAAYQPAYALAVNHAGHECQSNSSTCTFNATSQSPAAPLPKQCVSAIWYNSTSAAVTTTFSITNTSGWSDAINITGTVNGTINGGASSPVEAKVSGALTGTVANTFTFNVSQTLGNTVSVPVPAGQYGWVELAELAVQVTGTWTFDIGGFPWTANDTVTVPLMTDSTGGASIYTANTSPAFTGCSA